LGFGFCLISILAILLGILFVVSSTYATQTKVYRYDNICELHTRCTLRFEIEEDMDPPVYMYYRLENYYAAHRRYFKSVNDPQLMDKNVNTYSKLSSCDPKISRHDDHDSEDIYLPCGLIAYSYFNDTYQLLRDDGIKVDQTSKHIELPRDKRLYTDPGPDTHGIRLVDSFENPHFMVWMRVGALPNFNKLYAIINHELKKGLYKIEIDNNYPVREFDGHKLFFLSTTTWIGGPKYYVGGALLIAGVGMLIVSTFICVKSCIWPRKLGSIAYLEWD